ncbi:MAG TPA: hypothetical protein PKN83_26785 [Leptospiraceae bacterium]|nr:hypothetical protein [Leptospiraceae bacterium]HNL75586.1 hypothetical protein [Leptospiraceae bacterium]HNM92294.1 hypothetical protein [Leptospiraceae bacterium]
MPKKQTPEKGLKKTSIQLKHDVYLSLKNASDITGEPDYRIIDQALRKFFRLPTPTIEQQIKGESK